MPTRPRLYGGSKLPGLAAVILFAVLVAVTLGAEFPDAAGIAVADNVTAAIGYAMFDLEGGDVPAESFLAVFLMIAVVLDAALEGSIMLAQRDDDSGGER